MVLGINGLLLLRKHQLFVPISKPEGKRGYGKPAGPGGGPGLNWTLLLRKDWLFVPITNPDKIAGTASAESSKWRHNQSCGQEENQAELHPVLS
ncbi:hypothetical protein ABN229_18040, partial [Proteus terrae]|uniref:hypothetical protein n=1 Tax=Proteus terrae TaxID=1574161 RepID=UPI0032D9DB10